MKKITLLFLIIFSALNAQSISDYEYVYIPKKFEGFKENQYKLNEILQWKLKGRGYKVLTDEPQLWSAELRQNPCRVLTAVLRDDSSFFTNKIVLDFEDCNKTKVASFKGKSNYKDYTKGFRDALANAMKLIETPNPIEHYSNVAETMVVVTKKKVKNEFNNVLPKDKQITEEVVEQKVVSSNKPEIYTDGKIELSKINLSEDSFVLTQPNSSTPYAIFRPSAKEGVYRVKLGNNINTIGYKSGNQISIDVPNGDDFVDKVFELKK
ncbi:hypothetical protein KRX57_09705 [Weeksellaceae bacterium TAE3-ERU29]|nr:hypothetical protein [Weeksellaceae bacterium TAE3-ERU29]